MQVGRRIKFGGNGIFYYIATITGETTLTLDQDYAGTSSAVETYEILPQEEYNLPPQVSHRMFMWHEMYGYPFKMNFMTDQDFFRTGIYRTIKYIPVAYRMWGQNDAINQPLQPSVMSISSSSTADTTIPITIFGSQLQINEYFIFLSMFGSKGNIAFPHLGQMCLFCIKSTQAIHTIFFSFRFVNYFVC